MSRVIPPEKWIIFRRLRDEGYTRAEACRRSGISMSAAFRFESGSPVSTGRNVKAIIDANNLPRVKTRPQLTKPALRALDDFAFFRVRYFGRTSTPWQIHAANEIVQLLATEDREYVVINCPPGSGKALALDTPIPTPSGWTTMKDVQVGEQVLDERGQPCTVTFKSEVFYDHDCYEVRTDDGASVIADADHLWQVRMNGHGQYGKWRKKADYAGKTGPKPSADGRQIHTTRFLARERTKRPQLQIAAPLNLPEADLPIDPYILGVWLGDGHSDGARITCHPTDAIHIIPHLRATGYHVEHKGGLMWNITGTVKYRRDGLATHLRLANLLGNKHIPAVYFRASAAQRLALLQGLIDTDGYVAPSGHIEFCSTNRRLAEGVQQLVWSLGAKAGLSVGRASVNGKDCGEKYRVTFYLHDAARLPRKAERCRNGKRTPSRYLTVTPAPSVPTQCIQVDSPNHLYLAGEGMLVTHNTTAFTHDLLAWLAARDRNIRVMIGSRTENQARDHTRRLRNTFERTMPDTATSTEIAKGLREDAATTLTADYGRFKPERQDRWQERSFVIATERDQAGSDKEVSFAAYGSDSAFLGGRYDVIVWDDLVDPKNLGTIEIREKLFKWYEDVAETRLEPGGLLLLIGQRMTPDDIYRWALDQKTLLFDEEGELLPDEDQELAPGRYKHIVYKAHYDDKCSPGSHKLNAPPWPEGCLLDPKRLSWRFLAPKQKQNADSYATVYQQEDTDPANVLVRKEWVDGGKGTDGEYHPGCKDTDRGLLGIPEGLAGPHLRIVTADPSPTKYWSIQDYLYGQQSKFRYLLNLLNQSMDAPDFLGYNLQSQRFYGVLEEWWQISKDQGRPITHVIVEEAAAQRYLLQFDHVREWQRSRKVRIIGHATHRNKADAKFGVQSLGPVWRQGLIRLPWGDEAGRQASMKLIHEVTRWPHGSRDDNVMAEWFLEWQLGTNALFKQETTDLPTRSVPRWVNQPLGRRSA